MTLSFDVVRLGPLVPGESIGRVELATSSAVYLGSLGRPLIVVHGTGGCTPTSLQLGDNELRMLRVSPGDGFTLGNGILRLGPFFLDLRASPRWLPESVAPTTDEVLRTPAARTKVRTKVRTNFAQLRDDPRVQAAHARLGDRVAGLALALARPSCADAVRAAVHRLIGFGPGLTPSGDDFLVGLLAALDRATGEPGGISQAEQLRAGVHGALDRTSLVSQHYLRLAIDCAYSEDVLATLAWLQGRSGAAHERACGARALLDSGATSGADTVAGLLIGLALTSRFAYFVRPGRNGARPYSVRPGRKARGAAA